MEHLCNLLYPSNDIIRNWQAFYALEKNSVDLLVVGSSHAYSSFDGEIFEEVTGMRTYTLASNSQNVTQSYFNVKEALNYQKPKAILLEAFGINENNNWQNDEGDAFDRDWKKESNIDGMRLGVTKLEAISVQYLPENWPYALFRICRCHQNWKDTAQIQSNVDFLQEGVKDFSAFRPSQTSMSPKIKRRYKRKKVNPAEYQISKVNEIYFHKLATLCREEGIELYVVMAPIYKGWTKKVNYESRYQKICALAESESVPYLDCNLKYEEIGLKAADFEDAFSSYNHLNLQGAQKVSYYTAERMKK